MPPAAPFPARVRAWFSVLAAGALVALALVLPASPAAAATDEPSTDGLVLVGVGGLHWSDIDRTTTPRLWGMVADGSVGSISVHALNKVTCPLDAWLTISAASRVAAPTDEADAGAGGSADSSGCEPLPSVRTTTEPHARVRGWSSLIDPTAASGVPGTPGTVGQRVADSGPCASAVGPGAAIALARPTGSVARYFDALDADGSVLRTCRVTVLDVGELPTGRAERLTALADLDRQLRTITAQVPAGTDVVVAGVSDSPTGEAGLQAVVDWRRGGGPVAWLTSASTRLPGVVTLTDLSATIVQRVGGETADLDGSPLETGSERRMTAQRTLDNRRYLTEMTTVTPYLLPVVLAVAGVGAAAVLGAVLVARRRRRGPGPALGRVAVAVVLVGASMPVGAQVAVLSRWWVRPAPLVAATVWFAVGTTVVALAAWLLSRLAPRGPWRLAAVAAGLAWLLTTADGLTGTALQQGSVFGITPTSGARYFGFGNTTFAAYAAASLVLAGAVVVAARRAGRPRAGMAVAVVVGAVSVLVDGWPTFGADFGGALTLVVAYAVLLLPLTAVGLTPRRVVGTLAAAVGVVVAVAVVDWARPGRSTHLGLFVQRVIDGDALDIVGRKASGAWATVDQPAGAVAALACLAVCAVLVGPDRWRPAALRRLDARWTGLRATVRALVVAALLGSLVNDSGVVVAVVLLAVGGGLLGASAMADRWVDGVAPDEPTQAPVARWMPTVVVASGGVFGVLLLLSTAAFPLAAQAGGATRADGPALLGPGAPVVVVGTGGVSWDDVTRAETPTLWGLLREGAPAAGVMAAGVEKCPAQGWLSISSGATTVADEDVDGTYVCRSWDVVPGPSGSAAVNGWSELVAAQPGAVLGTLGDALADSGACSTAIGQGAALGLARSDGAVGRYRSLTQALADPTEAFACPVTLVDAGTSDAGVSSVDTTLRRLLAVLPSTTTVLLVDTARAEPGTEALGVGVARIGHPGATTYLTSLSTRSTGVVRLTDTTATLLVAAGRPVPGDVAGDPIVVGDERPSQVDVTVDQLAGVNVRTHLLHDAAVPLGIAVAALALLLGVGRLALRRRPRARVWLDGALVVLACLPAGAVVMASTGWWRGDHALAAMWLSLALCTAAVAGGAALVGRRVRWAPVATVAAFTWLVLALDVLLGGRLSRGGLLGAPTAAGRPSIAIVGVLAAAGIATAAIGYAVGRRSGRPRVGAVVAGLVLVATVVLLLVGG